MLKNLKIGLRLNIGFSFLFIVLIIVATYGIFSIKSLNKEIAILVEDRMVKVEQAKEFKRIADAQAGVNGILNELNKTITSDKGAELLKKITGDIGSIHQQSTQVGDGSHHVQESAKNLAELAAQLEVLVLQFKV